MKKYFLIDKIHCTKTSNNASDEVYVKVNGEEKYRDTCFVMDKNDNATIDIEVKVNYEDDIKVELWDKDFNGLFNKDDSLGWTSLSTKDKIEGWKNCYGDHCKSEGNCKYEIHYRVVDEIRTIRINAIECLQQHSNCSKELLEKIQAISPQLEKVKDEIEVPEFSSDKDIIDKLLKKAHDKITQLIEGTDPDEAVAWLSKVVEGKDDVYVQILNDGDEELEGGGVFPRDGGSVGMTANQIVYTSDHKVDYIRIPADKGKITVLLKEKDALKADIQLGHLVLDETNGTEEYSTAFSCYDLTKPDQNQGAQYSISYSVGIEDWCKDATNEAQGRE